MSAAVPQHAVELERLTRRFTAQNRIPRSDPEMGHNLPGDGRPAAAREEITAVDGVDLQIPRGELFGLLGPNGAGKTTAIRMLCTLLAPSSGVARVWGHDVTREAGAVRRSIGVLLTGERSVYWRLTGRENLEYFATLYGVPNDIARRRIAGLLEQMELTPRADDLVERYSTGMRQRLALIKVMLHDPPVLLLDEPTTGLDPQAARSIRDLIRRLHREDGKTIILTTHYMEEADQLCERVGIIDHGRIIALDSPQALKRAASRGPVLRMEVDGAAGGLDAALRAVPGMESVTAQERPDGGWDVTVQLAEVNDALPRAVQIVGAQGCRVRHLQLLEPSLEDVFIALTGRRLRD